MRYIPTRLLLVLLMCCLWLPLQAAPYSYARPLPSPLDMFEAGMYWLRDWTGPENPEDPASLFTLMEEQASRSFDFAGMATVIAGPEYWAGNILKRSHFQRDLRDWLFLQLAREGGLLSRRPVRYWPVMPRRIGPYKYLAGMDVWLQGRARSRILFHFGWTSRGWRIQDVSLNGQRVTEYLHAHWRDQRGGGGSKGFPPAWP
ncbi:MAG TPA: hypothetical protein VN448_03620 [Gammaproteobacteria bacterium]|nr:hypothetical protein [Gammaproteobacteria bacterium]